MSQDKPEGRIHRRHFLKLSGAGLVASQLPDITLAQQSANLLENHRALLTSLLTNPEWNVPSNDGSESARTFYAAAATHERYYAGPLGRSLLRASLERLLENNGAHMKMVLETAKKHNVPKEIVFLALAESHWNPFGENNAKAAGYWQFIPGTAAMHGLQNVPTGRNRERTRYTKEQLLELKDERLDAEKSTDAAMRYIASLKHFFERIAQKNSFTVPEHALWTYAMWAYNRGPGHVRKTFLATKGNPILYPQTLLNQPTPGSAKADKVKRSRAESIHYVPKILAIRKAVGSLVNEPVQKTDEVASKAEPKAPLAVPVPKQEISPEPARPEQPEREDREEEQEETIELIEYRVQGGDNLTKIATWITPDPDFIELRKDQIRDYNERTQRRKLKDQLNKNERLDIPAQRIDVQPGDTLEKFAKIYCSGWPTSVAVNHLRFINGIRPDMQLQAGKKIIVPLQNN